MKESEMKKYETIAELAAAFKNGELDKKNYKLVLDNDVSYLTYCGPLPDDIEKDSDEEYYWLGKKRDEANAMFRGNGYADLLAACRAAGIPADWC
jgi:hypothetical protein